MIHADDLVENAVERFEDGDDNFGVDISIDNGVDTRACNAASGITTSGTTSNFGITMLRGGDDNFGVNVSIHNGVDTQACNAASGVTTSGTTGNFATTVLRGKRTLQEFFSSSDSPLPCLRLGATLGMIAWLGLMMSTSGLFFL